jgi:hypothetical protein
MSRAGFLSLEVEPCDREQTEDDEGFSSSLLATMATVKVRMLRHDHLLPEVWEEVVSRSRLKTLETGTRNFGLLKKLLQENREMSETLADLYRSNSSEWPISVTRVCGGCPSDRFGASREDHRYNVPNATSIHRLVEISLDQWRSTFSHLDPRYIPVFYNPEQQHADVIRLVRWLVGECEVQEVSAREHSALATSDEWRTLYKRSPHGVVLHRGHQQLEDEPYSPLARVTVFDTLVTGKEIHSALIMQRPFHLVLYPIETRDPDHPLRCLGDTTTNSARLEQLISVIHQ